MAAHDRRHEAFKAEQKKGGGAAAMPGGLLPPPTGPAPKRRKEQTTKQKQITHDWAYIVLWYEELRRHTPRGLALEPIGFPAIAAYRDLFELDMEPWEVDTLLQLDMVWLKSVPKEKKPKE